MRHMKEARQTVREISFSASLCQKRTGATHNFAGRKDKNLSAYRFAGFPALKYMRSIHSLHKFSPLAIFPSPKFLSLSTIHSGSLPE